LVNKKKKIFSIRKIEKMSGERVREIEGYYITKYFSTFYEEDRGKKNGKRNTGLSRLHMLHENFSEDVCSSIQTLPWADEIVNNPELMNQLHLNT
jgi:hypothetical protein